MKKYHSNPYEKRFRRNEPSRISAKPMLADIEDRRKKRLESSQPEEYFVQIGSFAQMRDARRLQKHFTRAGHRTVIKAKGHYRTKCYRVLVFVGNYLEHAEKAEQILLAKGYNNAFLVAD